MLQKIKIKSLEDIAVKLIRRDNETKKDYLSYHDTVKELEFEIKKSHDTNNAHNNKDEINIITNSKKDEKQITEELTKSLKTLNSSSGNQKVIQNGHSKCKSIESNLNKNKIYNIKNFCKNKNDIISFQNKKLIYTEKLYFPLDYNNVITIINDCYYPMLQIFQYFDNLKELIYSIEEKIEIYFNNDSFFSLNEKVEEILEDFIEEEKIVELIEFCVIIFLLQYFVQINNSNEACINEEIQIIYQECYLVFQKLYENLILKLLFNENYIKMEKQEINNEIIEKYINEFFIFIQKPKNNELIINKINENMLIIFKGLYNSIKKIVNIIKIDNNSSKGASELSNIDVNNPEEVLNGPIENLDNANEVNSLVNLCNFYTNQNSEVFKKFLNKFIIDQYKCFHNIYYYLNLMIIKNKIKSKNIKKNVGNKAKKSLPPFSYKKIQIGIYVYYDNFKILLEKDRIKEPFLPPIDNTKFTYTLVLDLDETLVHYIEEKDRHYVQVRPFAEYFISEMGKYFELVIFTSAEEEYANIVLKEIDKNNSISHKLYRRHVEYNNGFCLKDLNKLGRDIKKVCIIDNDKNNFKLHEDNGIEIKDFMGEQDDNELDLLGDLLLTIIESKVDDIRPLIKDINNKIKKIDEEKKNINNNC